jgi:hypothetical protein
VYIAESRASVEGKASLERCDTSTALNAARTLLMESWYATKTLPARRHLNGGVSRSM